MAQLECCGVDNYRDFTNKLNIQASIFFLKKFLIDIRIIIIICSWCPLPAVSLTKANIHGQYHQKIVTVCLYLPSITATGCRYRISHHIIPFSQSIPGMSSKTLTVSNQPHFLSNPCTHFHPYSGDDSGDPSSVSVLATEDKNRQDCAHGSGQGTPTVET
jgi:hypothetical protein